MFSLVFLRFCLLSLLELHVSKLKPGLRSPVGVLTSCSRCSALSRLIFSNSRSSSAVSSSSSSLRILSPMPQPSACIRYTDLSSSLLSLPEPSESASMFLVSASTRRRLASISSSPLSSCPGPASNCRLLDIVDSAAGACVPARSPVFLEKCTASASSSCARRSRG